MRREANCLPSRAAMAPEGAPLLLEEHDVVRGRGNAGGAPAVSGPPGCWLTCSVIELRVTSVFCSHPFLEGLVLFHQGIQEFPDGARILADRLDLDHRRLGEIGNSKLEVGSSDV